MKLFNDFNSGISYKIPEFLYPNNSVQFYNGPIPNFNKSIIDIEFYNRYKNSISNTSVYDSKGFINKINKKIEEKGYDEVYIRNKRIYAKVNHQEFILYDLVDIEQFLQLDEGYEKYCLGKAFSIFPNDNGVFQQELENLIEFNEDTKYEDDDEYEESEEQFRCINASISVQKIESFLTQKRVPKKEFKNKYTRPLINTLFKHAKKTKDIIRILEENESYNHRVKYSTDDIYNFYSWFQIFEKTDGYMFFELNGKLEIKNKNLLDFSSFSDNLNERINTLCILWGEYQTLLNNKNEKQRSNPIATK